MGKINWEKEVATEVEKTPGCTFGYIGNFETWGDNRCLMIWEKSTPNSIWRCEAIDMDKANYNRAIIVLEKIKLLNTER